MSERRQQLEALGPPILGWHHPRCRSCNDFANYQVEFSGGSGRVTRRSYCAEHLPEQYRPLQGEADQRYAARQERLRVALLERRSQ